MHVRPWETAAWLLLILLAPALASTEPEPAFAVVTSGVAGMDAYAITSPYQSGANRLHVLLPGALEQGRTYRVLYVLPVGGDAFGADESKLPWGTGERAILGDFSSAKFPATYENQALKHGLICVFPTFATCPWYGDNLGDPAKRHESHLLRVVLPFIEKTYPVVTEPRGRLLIGFSKSGFGALGLHLRHPDLFGGSISFDAPLMEAWPGRFGIKEHFGSEDAFTGWRMGPLIERQAPLMAGHRIVLSGYDLFRKPMTEAHVLLDRAGIAHRHLDGPARKHHWYSGWVPEALDALLDEKGGKP